MADERRRPWMRFGNGTSSKLPSRFPTSNSKKPEHNAVGKSSLEDVAALKCRYPQVESFIIDLMLEDTEGDVSRVEEYLHNSAQEKQLKKFQNLELAECAQTPSWDPPSSVSSLSPTLSDASLNEIKQKMTEDETWDQEYYDSPLKFLFSLVENDSEIEESTVKDILEHFKGDLNESSKALMNIIDSKHNMPAMEYDNFTRNGMKTSDSEFHSSLTFLLEAFPKVDPTDIVIALQENNWDIEGSSSALSSSSEANVDPQFRQLTESYPSIDEEVLKSVLSMSENDLDMAYEILKQGGVFPHSKEVWKKKYNHHPDDLYEKQDVGASNYNSDYIDEISFPPLHFSKILPQKGNLFQNNQYESKKSRDSFSNNSIDRGSPSNKLKTQPNMYCKERETALGLKKLRDYYFSEAGNAYNRKDKYRLMNMIQRGHEMDRKFREAQKKIRNHDLNNNIQGLKNDITIDLHRLHVEEAINNLERHVNYLRDLPAISSLTIITGRGRHSPGGQARIKPAVISYLEENGIKSYMDHGGRITITRKNLLDDTHLMKKIPEKHKLADYIP